MVRSAQHNTRTGLPAIQDLYSRSCLTPAIPATDISHSCRLAGGTGVSEPEAAGSETTFTPKPSSYGTADMYAYTHKHTHHTHILQ